MNAALALILLAWPARVYGAEREQGDASRDDAVVKEDIVIKGRRASGPPAWVPLPMADKQALDEVMKSLAVYRSDHDVSIPKIDLTALQRRLDEPFPGSPFLEFSPRSFPYPHQRWSFEVLEGDRVVWSSQGEKKLSRKLKWDGRDRMGRVVARVGGRYRLRFTGVNKDEAVAIESEPVRLDSLLYQEDMGDTVLEAAAFLLFDPKKQVLKEGASDYLDMMASWVGRSAGKDTAYKFRLHQEKPDSRLAEARAKALAGHIAGYLLLNPERVDVRSVSPDERGEVLSTVLPAGEGSVIRTR